MPTHAFPPPTPDPDDDQADRLALPPAERKLFDKLLAVRARADQRKAPPLDDHARDLIRRATWDLLPVEAAAHVELNIWRYQTWAEVAARETERRLAIEPLSFSEGRGDESSPD